MNERWKTATLELLGGYRRMIDAAARQLDDQQFFQRPQPNLNSVAVLLRHLGGNLQSRWSSFLSDDGEKPERDRDREFEEWQGDRNSLMDYFDRGWQRLISTVESLSHDQMASTVLIRGEPHSVPQAIQRTLTHVSYHVGQLVLIARWVKDDDANWQWLTIAPGQSRQHNQATWDQSTSRGMMGKPTA